MYHLAKSVYQQLTRKEEYSVLILGLDNAGKTTFLERLKGEFGGKSLPPERINPTIGQNVGHVIVDGMHLKLWDVGGQENLRTLWNAYYAECHAIVFVVDSTDRERLEECKNTLKEVVVNEATEGIPLLMLANKQDCEDSMDVVDIIEIFNKIAEHVSARDSRVLPISAKEGTGVGDAGRWLAVRLGRVPV
ncbi:ADP-ribosylation factor family-domain-containing protein [Yarrowia lipolytica]|uniref:YALI0D02995p n=2 Tax=Yarrowia lipolytica TaxID=4952 RepID=Q6CAG2_YARLI|nr:YALI0D02995p [Yarrowia lipolytica CLIB122]KAE8170640.1 ADP-ribosylation factor family-domain-containing protein [Yarrowia lipolytica]KAJ8054856.1 ADP-ribosylation factor family-domain-containing protein [Yarrowia lipolytica]QNP97622.1 ADP-ribosylation factor-like protein 3 [Yarrowia lipolytica]RDW25879.1 ADP-ribosylation factor family-domain-containing protein [Yarrowia lipolytica]RDW34477.1 ADP-ribosylation factor family-domain-containing protein [Yarrowia lipolytica]|eukprot:XP_502350.2 YALI0D02995p [Yarrowia lipolytica CLIB122]